MTDAVLKKAIWDVLPQPFTMLLAELYKTGFVPKVIYDIGSCTMGFTKIAGKLWPKSEIVMFDVEIYEKLYRMFPEFQHHINALGCDEMITLWISNSNIEKISAYRPLEMNDFFSGSLKRVMPLDSARRYRGFPQPDLIKINVQGGERDVILGGMETIRKTPRVILRTQNVEYNRGAPLHDEMVQFMYSLGFDLSIYKQMSSYERICLFTRSDRPEESVAPLRIVHARAPAGPVEPATDPRIVLIELIYQLGDSPFASIGRVYKEETIDLDILNSDIIYVHCKSIESLQQISSIWGIKEYDIPVILICEEVHPDDILHPKMLTYDGIVSRKDISPYNWNRIKTDKFFETLHDEGLAEVSKRILQHYRSRVVSKMKDMKFI